MALHEGTAQDILEEIRALPDVLGVALVKDGEISFSTLPGSKTGLIKMIARRLEYVGRPGDYVVKKSPFSSLIVIKGPGPYVLSVAGRGPEGVLISLANRLVSVLAENVEFSSPNSSSRDPEHTPGLTSLSLDAVPIIRPGFSTEIAIDNSILKVLKHINGLNSLRTLISVSGIKREEVIKAVTKLLHAGVIHIGTRGRETDDSALLKLAKVAYELDRRFSRPEEALRMLGDADEVLKLLAANLHMGLTAAEYKRLADEAGLDVSLSSIIKALESLRSMGIARRKGERRPSVERVRRDIPSTAISVLLTTMH